MFGGGGGGGGGGVCVGGGGEQGPRLYNQRGCKTLLWLAFNALTTRGCSKTSEVGESKQR